MKVEVNEEQVHALLKQILFFNHNFHESENNDALKDFHNLMRKSKDRCQLILIKFATPKLISFYPDKKSSGGEWLIGSITGDMATHIPLDTLKRNLSNDLLEFWNIN